MRIQGGGVRFWNQTRALADSTFMGKYKAAKKKSDAPPQVRPGLPCLIILVAGMVGTIILMILVLRNAS
jgi:hypothetical protein